MYSKLFNKIRKRPFKKLSKKSQLEVLGLAIVVILITLGVLFVIRFIVFKEPTEIRKSYIKTELASNMLNTLIRTDTTCRSKSITELLQDCASNPPNGSIDCGSDHSCKFLNETIEIITNKTLRKWNQDYQFDVWLEDGTVLIHTLSDPLACQGEKESKPFYLPLQVTTINLKLDLCS